MIRISSPPLHAGQRRIIKEIDSNNAFFNTIVCPRQWGKSVLAYMLMLNYGINNNRYYIVWATLTHQHAQDAMRKIYNAIKTTGIIKEYNKTERRIELTNGSTLYFAGMDKYENYRGKSTHVLIIDEAALLHPKAFTALMPSMAAVGKKCFLISTPRGKMGEFWKYYCAGTNGKKDFASYRGFLEENPYRNMIIIEADREMMPEYVFRQEYIGEFLDSEFSLFKNLNDVAILNEWQTPQPYESYFGGIDCGRANDYTVLTIMNSKKEVVYCYRDRQKTWEYMVDHIVTKLKEYDSTCLVEVNNVGDVVYEMIRNKYNKVQPFTTGEKTKQIIIEKLIVDFENKNIFIPSENLFSHLKLELEQFQFSYSPKSRSIKYSAPPGLHDDTVISLALANKCYSDYRVTWGANVL